MPDEFVRKDILEAKLTTLTLESMTSEMKSKNAFLIGLAVLLYFLTKTQ